MRGQSITPQTPAGAPKAGLHQDAGSQGHQAIAAELACWPFPCDGLRFHAQPFYLAFVSAAVNGWHSQQDASAKDLIFGGVLIFGIDSHLGRVYFVYGQTEGQRSRMHLQLNRIF